MVKNEPLWTSTWSRTAIHYSDGAVYRNNFIPHIEVHMTTLTDKLKKALEGK